LSSSDLDPSAEGRFTTTMATREIEELFAQALTGDYDDEAAWEAVRALRALGTREVFERAAELCVSNDPLARARGAAVLGQLGRTFEHRNNSFADECFTVLTNLVERETYPQPLASGIAALGHLGNPPAIPLIASFSSHPNPEVRFDVAFALGCFPNEPLSIETLLVLMGDTDKDVRDWATFGLGVLGELDSAKIREALVGRLTDADEDVREEAMVGLGKRKDRRVLSSLLAALEQPSVTVRVIEAAYEMLGMPNDREEWKGMDYAVELRRRFLV
jgi:HEAT repeat protein